MKREGALIVRLFGKLLTFQSRRGRPTTVTLQIPAEGVLAERVVADLDLPREDVEGVFCNHKVYGLDHVLRPGDRVAFVPRGTPGPHRFTLGLYSAGRGEVKS